MTHTNAEKDQKTNRKGRSTTQQTPNHKTQQIFSCDADNLEIQARLFNSPKHTKCIIDTGANIAIIALSHIPHKHQNLIQPSENLPRKQSK